MLRVFGLFGFLLCCPWLLAHPAEVCLERVADSSEMLKICQLNQRYLEECNVQKTTLQHRIDDCRAAMFIDKDIAAARKVGADRVNGDVTKSPYRQLVRSQQALARSVEPNLQAFRLYFQEADYTEKLLVEHFDSERCPNRYEGAEKRWNLAKVHPVNRFPMDNVVQDAGPKGLQTLTLYLLTKERVGKCYSGQEGDETDSRYLVVSIPDQVYRELLGDSDKRVLICEDDLCENDFKALESLYREYRQQYQEYALYSECSEILYRNSTRLRAKSQSKRALELPGSCPDQELDQKLAQARARVSELDQGLFGAETVQIVRPNSL